MKELDAMYDFQKDLEAWERYAIRAHSRRTGGGEHIAFERPDALENTSRRISSRSVFRS